MPQIEGLVDFDPARDIPSLEGKVILITGGIIIRLPSPSLIEQLTRYFPFQERLV